MSTAPDYYRINVISMYGGSCLPRTRKHECAVRAKQQGVGVLKSDFRARGCLTQLDEFALRK